METFRLKAQKANRLHRENKLRRENGLHEGDNSANLRNVHILVCDGIKALLKEYSCCLVYGGISCSNRSMTKEDGFKLLEELYDAMELEDENSFFHADDLSAMVDIFKKTIWVTPSLKRKILFSNYSQSEQDTLLFLSEVLENLSYFSKNLDSSIEKSLLRAEKTEAATAEAAKEEAHTVFQGSVSGGLSQN